LTEIKGRLRTGSAVCLEERARGGVDS